MIKSKDSKKSSPSDWLQVGMDGGVLLLGLIQDVASLAPVPYLSTAAGLTIKIVDTVQRFRGNKEDFKQLAEDVTAIVAVVCDSYKESAKKDEWPPHDLVPVIADLLTTLQEIYSFIQDQQARNQVSRFLCSSSDEEKIEHFRERLAMAVDKLQIASHLNLNNAVTVIIQQQNNIQSKLDTLSSTDVKTSTSADNTSFLASTHSQFEHAIDSDVKDTVAIAGNVGHDDCTIAHGASAHTQFKNSRNVKIESGSIVVAGSMSARSFAEVLSRTTGKTSSHSSFATKLVNDMHILQKLLEISREDTKLKATCTTLTDISRILDIML